jgi:lipopolysaccharide transport system permease protein
MTGVVGGFRWAILSGIEEQAASFGIMFAISIAISILVLVSGVIYFRLTERTFADII